jgi:autotransporter-associated beta strand protein
MRTSWIRKALFGSRSRTLRRAIRTDASTSLQLERLEDRFAPAIIVWNQTAAGTFSFATGSNWQGGVAPGPNDVASFTNNIAANETINLASAVTLKEIVIGDADNTNSFSLTGSTITLDSSSGIVKNLGAGSTNTTADTIANAITLGASNTSLTNNYAFASLSLGGAISGAFSFSVNKTGNGTVILSGINAFSGGTTISAGTLSISSDANLGASAGGITLNGGTLLLTGTGDAVAIAAARTITLSSAGGTIDTSGLGAGSGNQTSIAANIVGTGPLTLKAHGDTSDAGASSDSYLDLTGTNTFLGNVTISSGVVYANDASFGSTANALTLSGGGLVAPFSTTIARAITLVGSGTLRTYGGTSVTFSGPIGGTGTLAKSDGGAAVLTGTDIYSGGTRIGGGTLQIGNGGTGSIGSGGVVDLGTLVFDTSSNVTVAGVISGPGSLTQSGSGTTDLQGANLFTGPTVVSAGILIGDGPNSFNGALGTSSTITVNNGGTLESGGTDNGLVGSLGVTTGTIILNAGGTLTTSSDTTTNHLRAITLAGGILGGTGTLSGNSLLYGRWDLDLPVTVLANTGAVSTISALGVALTETSGTQFFVNNSGASPDLAVTGVLYHPLSIADNGLVKSGAGTMILSGVDTYTGGTTISAGTLEIGDGTNDGSIASPSIVDNAMLVFNDANALVYNGVVSGSGALLKSNSGTLTLLGNDTYTGATTISGGILQLGNGTLGGSLASSSIVDNATLNFNDGSALTYGGTISGTGTLNKSSGGTLTLTGSSGSNVLVTVSVGTLAGSGSIGAVSVAGGATVAPGGASGSATLSTGAVSFVSGSTFHANINGTAAGSGYDQLNVNGTVNLNGATLAIAGSLVPTAGSSFVLVSNDAGDPIAGNFNGLSEGALVSNNFLGSGLSARITYVGGGGNDVAIIVNTPPRDLARNFAVSCAAKTRSCRQQRRRRLGLHGRLRTGRQRECGNGVRVQHRHRSARPQADRADPGVGRPVRPVGVGVGDDGRRQLGRHQRSRRRRGLRFQCRHRRPHLHAYGADAGGERWLRPVRVGVENDGRRRCARQRHGRTKRGPSLRDERNHRSADRDAGGADACGRRLVRLLGCGVADDDRGRGARLQRHGNQ